ncbi:MAG: hypothetical protein RL885_19900 [Planctomycetota bacterium]
MESTHHLRLLAGYGLALLGWWIISRWRPGLWPGARRVEVARSPKEVALLIAGLVGVIALGQLYQRDIRLPSRGTFGPILEGLNHVIIFAPICWLIFRPQHGPASGWIPDRQILFRLGCGVALAVLAVSAYVLAGGRIQELAEILRRIPTYGHVDEAMQVAVEDLAIGIMLVRLGCWLSTRGAIVLTAVLFVAGHIPAQIDKGTPASELLWLLPDVGLALLVLTALFRSRDILWFWPVHTVLDLMQFEHVYPVAS